MKSLSILCLLFSAFLMKANDPIVYQTGPQPLAIHRIGNIAHVFCNGDDKDYDGMYEPNLGEKPALWITHDINTGNQLHVKTMEKGYFSLPFRSGFSSTKLFHPRGNRIEVYDLAMKSLLDSAIFILPDSKATITAIHVITEIVNGVETETLLAFSHKMSFTDKGSFSIYDIAKKSIVATIEVGINPQMIRSFRNLLGEMEFVVLSEGTFGGGNSMLHRLLPTPSMNMPFSVTSFELGDTGNYVEIIDQLALTLMNGSHEVFAINLATNQLLPGSFPVGTSGYDGPRELTIDPSTNQVFISTYASDIRIGSLEDGTMLDSWSTKGKAEGLAIINDHLWVCNAFKKGDYVYDSLITVFPLRNTSSTHDPMNTVSMVSMHDGVLTITRPNMYDQAEYVIINSLGEMIVKDTFTGTQTMRSCKDLPHGLYGISIVCGAKTEKYLIIHSD